MPSTRRIAALLLVCVAVSLAGCSALPGGDDGGTNVDPSNYDAQQLQSDAVTATGNASTYGFTFDQELTTQAESGPLTFGLDATGRADEPADRTEIDFRTWLGSEDQGVDAEGYHVGDTVHQRSQNSSWNSSTAASGYWAPAGQDVALLEDADVEITGADTVNGQDAIVLDVEPAANETVETYGLDQTLVGDLLRSGVSLTELEVQQYVAAEEPYRILRTEIDVTFTAGESSVDGELSTTYDYDGGASVELPESLPN